MTARPFLFLSARPENEAVGPEVASIRSAMGAHELIHHRVDAAPLPDLDLDAWSGIVVGGSPFNVTTPENEKSAEQRRVESELAGLAERALDTDFPVLFTCYGIGVLTRVLGGEVGLEYGEDAAAVSIALSDDGIADPLTGVLPPVFTALVGHKEATSRLPSDARLLAGSSGCPVQIYRAGAHVYATQFHPEVTTADFIERAHVYQHHGYFPARELRDVSERLFAASVTEPRHLLRRFVELYER
ncbi:glutamine amidotransferase [Agromyces atrinae]|uniref:GMP synthase (Glutamine-hydrolyzing) n=1 Tax=Agromyces atrinae TaxID=592376 RepID=A0A4Q2M605_9MICO|nr:glutamine amidotransferase [Agromyces atrinae]MCI2957760.1 glutamine amidotransferase [Agromyces atrinae]NYD66931.1 GMP synthase (glutamine-hydrolyzing) [Agromyces atrinae]RXZ87575.1 glutamine amidotransferase [Agromyces atrinae]